MNETIAWLVELELKRVQTLLFEVPRLAVMIGTNALVGETLRGLWNGCDFSDSPDSLPHLANSRGSKLPEELNLGDISFPRDNDPLEWRKNGHLSIWQDDVLEVAKATGVVTRDGGHFAALFSRQECALNFVTDAHELIARKLAGARIEARLFCLRKTPDGYCKPKEPQSMESREQVNRQAVFDLAQAEICELSGREPAAKITRVGTDDYRVAQFVHQRRERGKAFDDGETHDVLGILRDQILARVSASPRQLAGDFNELSTQGYLAVVHVDGNSVGKRFKIHRDQCRSTDYFAQWAYEETFFHHLRIGMRKAAVDALAAVFQGKSNRQGKLPFRVLMLGGDDLVLVCGAPYALPFVRELASNVHNATANLTSMEGGKEPLAIAAGVAIVQETFPFHRVHQLAEQLASSAKRIKHLGSAVDWIVTSEAWYGDVKETRRRAALVDDRLILSMKPYPILADKLPSLKSLLDDAESLCGNQSVARTQLQRLIDCLEQGEYTARFVAETLPENVRKPLQDRRYLDKGSPWFQADGMAATRLLDLFELYELDRLRRIEEGELGQAEPTTSGGEMEETHA